MHFLQLGNYAAIGGALYCKPHFNQVRLCFEDSGASEKALLEESIWWKGLVPCFMDVLSSLANSQKMHRKTY
jgi:hypothetical protein